MRLQFRHLLLSWAVSCTCTIALAPPAQAQSFFQKLFGFGGSSAPAPAAHMTVRPLPAYRFRQRKNFERELPPDEDEIGPPDSGGPYRTMCVRACDGFYFPLRHNAKRRNFSSDVKSCRAACGDEARLFYYPEHSGSVDTMTDLGGRPYKEMPQAFAYRKSLVAGCGCKPTPWSHEEVARHRSYAVAEVERETEAETQRTVQAPAAKTELIAPPLDVQPGPQVSEESAPPTAEITIEQQQVAVAEPAVEPAAAPAPRFISQPRRAERPWKRKAKSRYARVRYVPTSGYAGKPKSGLVWPGD